MPVKKIFITGATSGIGMITACELASAGNTIIATARSAESGKILSEYYKTNYAVGLGTIKILICDLSSFESIVVACNELKTQYNCIDTLINNAGVWNFTYKESKDKIEEILQVNVLAPLLINHLLFGLLVKSSEAKSIFAASGLHQGDVNFANLEFKKKFSGVKAYRQSKLEVILLCRLFSKKLENSNIGVYCEHPGFVSTKLGRNANWFANLFFRLMGITPQKGAKTLLFLANTPKINLTSGEYYYLNAVKRITRQSYDMSVAEKLLNTLKTYLAKYITSPSPIFN